MWNNCSFGSLRWNLEWDFDFSEDKNTMDNIQHFPGWPLIFHSCLDQVFCSRGILKTFNHRFSFASPASSGLDRSDWYRLALSWTHSQSRKSGTRPDQRLLSTQQRTSSGWSINISLDNCAGRCTATQEQAGIFDWPQIFAHIYSPFQ